MSAFAGSKSGGSKSKETEAKPEMVLIDPDATLDANSMAADPVLQALRKPSSERTDDNLQTILLATADVKFLQRLSPEEHRELCRVIQLVFIPKDTAIFEQGDEGTSFYVIYLGAAKVYVDYEKPSRAASLGMMGGLSSTKLGAQVATSQVEVDLEGGNKSSPKPSCVCVLEDGDSFGELALMGSGVRQASVRTAMPTHLLKIDKDVYDRSLQKLHEAELNLRVQFVRGVFIFSDWSDEDLRRISHVMTSRRYEKNTTIIAQGDHTDAMYFIKKGNCRVLKRMHLSQRQHGMLGLTPRGRGSGSPRQPSRAQPEETLLEISELTVRQYFGEMAMLDKGPHTASVVSVNAAEVLVLSKYDFYHLVDTQQQQLMQDYAKKFYFDEGLIRKTIDEQHQWNTYRDKVCV